MLSLRQPLQNNPEIANRTKTVTIRHTRGIIRMMIDTACLRCIARCMSSDGAEKP